MWTVKDMHIASASTVTLFSNFSNLVLGIVEGIMVMETIMDHVATYLGVDPLSVREVNLAPTGAPRPQLGPFGRNVFAEDILPLLKTSASWEERQAEVAAFNLVSYIFCAIYTSCHSYTWQKI